MSRTPLIAGNWKMNFDHLQAIAFVQKLAWQLKDARHDFSSVEVAVFPPFTDLRSVQTLVDADKLPLRFGAQDVSENRNPGAFTGEIPAMFLAKLECSYAIIGHSERRQYHGESDELVASKAKAALSAGITPVICVGETADDLARFGSSEVPASQLRACLTGLAKGTEVVVAYEPVWAIGSGQAATPEQAQTVATALRAVVSDVLGEEAGQATRILYGGSVKAENIAAFMKQADVDGALVGGASLDVEQFASIVRYQQHVTY